ncbi:unnamed protein product, partial [marine sediment metagenome]
QFSIQKGLSSTDTDPPGEPGIIKTSGYLVG